MGKLCPKFQGLYQAQGVPSGRGLGVAYAPRSWRLFGADLCSLGYMLPCFILQYVELNLQGLFKSEMPVVIFLHLVLKIKNRTSITALKVLLFHNPLTPRNQAFSFKIVTTWKFFSSSDEN